MEKSEKPTQKDMTHKTQAHVLQAIAESTMYNCQVRKWHMSEINWLRWQMLQKYFELKTNDTIKKMEQKKNRWEVRKELGTKSIRLKIDKRRQEG